MITLKDVIQKIVNVIKVEYKDIPVHLEGDLKEGFTRPCFFIRSSNDSFTWIGTQLLKTDTSIRISYFPTSDKINQIGRLSEIKDVELNLSLLFSRKLEVATNFVIPIVEGITNSITDSILHSDFELTFVQKITSKEEESLELLKYLFANYNYN